MNIDRFVPHTPLFLQNPTFWWATVILTAGTVVALVFMYRMENLSRRYFLKAAVPSMLGVLTLGIILMSFVASSEESEKQIRGQLTEHYNLQDDIFYEDIRLTSTERLQEVGSSSAVKNGEVILSKYDKAAGTVKLYVFEADETVELPSS